MSETEERAGKEFLETMICGSAPLNEKQLWPQGLREGKHAGYFLFDLAGCPASTASFRMLIVLCMRLSGCLQ